MTTQDTAKQMLERNGVAYEAHGSGWGFFIDGRFFTPHEAINHVIDQVPKITAADAGTWLDGHMGWHNHYRAIDRAVSYGMPYSADDDAIRDAYADEAESVTLADGEVLDQDSVAEAILGQGELLDKATDYLQSLAPKGYAFIWDMGELSLSQVNDDGEPVY